MSNSGRAKVSVVNLVNSITRIPVAQILNPLTPSPPPEIPISRNLNSREESSIAQPLTLYPNSPSRVVQITQLVNPVEVQPSEEEQPRAEAEPARNIPKEDDEALVAPPTKAKIVLARGIANSISQRLRDCNEAPRANFW